MSTLAATVTIIGAVLAIVSLAVGLQTFWISRSIGRVENSVDGVRGELKDARDELKGEIAEIRDVLLRDHGERLARLEATR